MSSSRDVSGRLSHEMAMDEKALEAVFDTHKDDVWLQENMDPRKYIETYLAALPPLDGAAEELVRALRSGESRDPSRDMVRAADLIERLDRQNARLMQDMADYLRQNEKALEAAEARWANGSTIGEAIQAYLAALPPLDREAGEFAKRFRMSFGGASHDKDGKRLPTREEAADLIERQAKKIEKLEDQAFDSFIEGKGEDR